MLTRFSYGCRSIRGVSKNEPPSVEFLGTDDLMARGKNNARRAPQMGNEGSMAAGKNKKGQAHGAW